MLLTMKFTLRLICLFIVSYIFLFSCNNSTESSGQEEGLKTIVTEADNKTPETFTEDGSLEARDDDKLLFKSASWYKGSGKNEIFNGLNTSLMKGVIFHYVVQYHIDPNISAENAKDSISVKLKYYQFSFYHKTESKFTMYDVELDRINFENRIGYSDEKISQAELDEHEKMLQKKISAIDPNLKKNKIYNREIIYGKYQILQVKNDSIRIKIEGQIRNVDALTFETYGELGLGPDNPFSDEVTIDLAEAFNDIGRLYYFEWLDLEVINNQALKYLRNQFFARRGYIFKTEAMKEYFGKKPWYTPDHEDVSNLLSTEEKHNAELIKQFEDQVK